MTYLIIPDTGRPYGLPFFFAVEEYVARHFTDDDYFFIWTVNPTVMLGRNQLIESEVNISYCKAHDVNIFRRKSGGGCVYADRGCLQFSFIINNDDVSSTFCEYMQVVADILKDAGVEAQLSGRNDILVDGKKVAGAAFYKVPNRSVLHNTLLYQTNLEHLEGTLTPSDVKLASKGVKSVKQRVVNVGDYTHLSIDEFIEFTRRNRCGDRSRKLTSEDFVEIEKIEKTLASDEFVYGKNPKYTIVKKHRFEGIGTFEALLEIKNDILMNVNIVGDYFLLGDIDHEILEPLRGVAFSREAVSAVFQDKDLSEVIRGMKLENLLRLFFGRAPHTPKPSWLRINIGSKVNYKGTMHIIRDNSLNTICTSGLCPNRAECWGHRTATFMIGGNICTRNCRFCNTLTGKPLPLDPKEPQRVADSIRDLGIKYAVITSVDRDDLDDLGVQHWKETVECVRSTNPEIGIEILIPDFQGRKELLDIVLSTRPDVVGHNVETVRRLTPNVRSAAFYDRSLDVLRAITAQGLIAKTGFMLGLGETKEEIEETIRDIRETGCEILTIGQYLQPSSKHLPVSEYVTPEQFERYKELALGCGFAHVESGPMVRSSYHAEEAAAQARLRWHGH